MAYTRATLTDLIPQMHIAANIVARKLVGYIPSVYKNSSAERAALNEEVIYPIADPVEGVEITPSMTIPNTTLTNAGSGSMKITDIWSFPIAVSGEDTKGLKNSGQYEALMQDRFVEAMSAAVNKIEAYLAGLYTGASRAVKYATTKPFNSSFEDALAVNKILTDNGAPLTDRTLVLDTAAAMNLKNLSNYSQAMAAGGNEFRQGVIFPLDGLDIRQSAQVKKHTGGTYSTVAIDKEVGYLVGTKKMAVSATGIASKIGDGIKIGTTNKPEFYIVRNVLVDQAGDLEISKPGLMEAVAHSAAVTGLGNYTANMAFHRSAIHLVTRAPAMPDGGDAADDAVLISDPLSGLSFEIRHYKGYHKNMMELVVAFGGAVVNEKFLATLAG